ncbi:hypothetical protein SANT12839_059140 [Streptomyces antimycoticus]|uniref:Uncharacterized protein n=1 Tax=Streptomyces antimycoticus TaxID=68175 RepID=A0A4D4K9U8_9ACTN|nr:hypothetical protein SANT12839_059140 [Streptomyces antimycoticus]
MLRYEREVAQGAARLRAALRFPAALRFRLACHFRFGHRAPPETYDVRRTVTHPSWAKSKRLPVMTVGGLALIYGSPVPSYAAPQDTIASVARVPRVLMGILRETNPRPRSRARR